jgi:hypothetical protein
MKIQSLFIAVLSVSVLSVGCSSKDDSNNKKKRKNNDSEVTALNTTGSNDVSAETMKNGETVSAEKHFSYRPTKGGILGIAESSFLSEEKCGETVSSFLLEKKGSGQQVPMVKDDYGGLTIPVDAETDYILTLKIVTDHACSVGASFSVSINDADSTPAPNP